MTDNAPAVHFCYEVTKESPARVRRLVDETGFFAPAEVDVAEELVVERLSKGEASGYHFIFAEQGDGLAGYACFGPIACTVGSYDLYWIAVDPAHQGHGLGRRMLVEAERLIAESGGRHIYIETSGRPQYAPTRRFYERCDYDVLAVFGDFYAPGDDKFVFRKVLDELHRLR